MYATLKRGSIRDQSITIRIPSLENTDCRPREVGLGETGYTPSRYDYRSRDPSLKEGDPRLNERDPHLKEGERSNGGDQSSEEGGRSNEGASLEGNKLS